jgi:hypothetical protein
VLPEPRRREKEVVLVRRTLIILAMALFTLALSGPASAQPKGPGSFTFHLECENGAEFDILVPVGQSFAALVQGSNSVAVLKGVDEDFDGTPEFLVPGFSLDDLTACTVFEAGEPIFLFLRAVDSSPAIAGTTNAACGSMSRHRSILLCPRVTRA